MAARRTGRTREDDGSKEEIAECGAARRAEKRHQPGVGRARFRGAGNPQAGRPPMRQQLPPKKSARREGVRGAVRADTRRTWTRVPGRAPSAVTVTTSFFSQRSRPTRRAGNVSPRLLENRRRPLVAPQNPAGTRGRAAPCATLRLTLTLTLMHAPSPPRAPSQPHAFTAEARTRPQEGNVRPEIAGSGLRRASAARLPSESPFCRPRPRAQTSGFADALEPPPVGQTRSRWVSLPPSALPATVHATVSGYV